MFLWSRAQGSAMKSNILAIDQGTTSSRAIVFDGDMKITGVGQKEFTQHFPASGWVEHDPEEIWASVVATCKAALKKASLAASDIAAIGITNQRETVVIWDKATGQADPQCDRLAGPAHCAAVRQAEEGRVWNRHSPARPGCCSTLIFPAPRSPGCSTTSRARANAPRRANCSPAPSTVFSSGG